MNLTLHPGTWIVAKLQTAESAIAALPLLQPPLYCLLGDDHGWTLVGESSIEAKLTDVVSLERDWCCFQVDGVLEFSMVGVLAELTQGLANAGVSVYALSSFETDYLLVKKDDRSSAVRAMEQRGHVIHRLDL